MTPSDAMRLLALMNTFDGRPVTDAHAVTWAEALKGIEFADARTAILEWYNQRETYAKPVNIINLVKDHRVRAREASDHPGMTPEEWAVVYRDRERAASVGLTVRQMALKRLVLRNPNHPVADLERDELTRIDEILAGRPLPPKGNPN